jgi:hypothetical protein
LQHALRVFAFRPCKAEPRNGAALQTLLRGGRNEEAVMPLLFWYPIIVWSSMCSLALDNVTPRKARANPPHDQGAVF